jgi:tetratricopeptide (TPR) repeat protein
MTRLSGIIVIILISIHPLSCSIERRMSKKSVKAFDLVQNGKNYQAGERFYYLATRFPESNLYGRNLWNAAWLYAQADSHQLAKKIYSDIIASNVQDSETDSTRGIHETHTNYKHHSCIELARYALKDSLYRECLHWVFRAQYSFPYYNFKIKEIRRNELLVSQLKSICYEQLEKPDSALVEILPFCLQRSPWNKKLAAERAITLIDRHFNRDTVAEYLQKGIQNRKVLPTHLEIQFMQFQISVVPYEGGVESIKDSEIEDSYLLYLLCGVD